MKTIIIAAMLMVLTGARSFAGDISRFSFFVSAAGYYRSVSLAGASGSASDSAGLGLDIGLDMHYFFFYAEMGATIPYYFGVSPAGNGPVVYDLFFAGGGLSLDWGLFRLTGGTRIYPLAFRYGNDGGNYSCPWALNAGLEYRIAPRLGLRAGFDWPLAWIPSDAVKVYYGLNARMAVHLYL